MKPTYVIAVCASPFVAMFGIVFGLILLGGFSSDSLAGACFASGPSAQGQPPLVAYYLGAAAAYKLGPIGYAYLAAINKIETEFGTDIATSSKGAIGWMQFMPSTFAQYGVSITNPRAPADPDDPQDAIYTAARYLHAGGAPGDWPAAIFAYNHAGWYVAEVQSDALRYVAVNGLANLAVDISAAWGDRQPPTPGAVYVSDSGLSTAQAAALAQACPSIAENIDVTPVPGTVAVIMPNGLARPPAAAPTTVQAMIAAADRIDDFDYQWGGGHANPALSDSQTNPQPQGGLRPGDNGTPGYDCSGSTDYVLWGGGFGQSILAGSDPASGELEQLGDPGPGRWVTWWANNGHVFIQIAGIVFDTGHQFPARPTVPSTGPRWTILADVAAQQAADGPFEPRHPEGL
ncbi:MAG: lytic transglycosylase domain-containing protein [Solirubrobacteraceae bacterium]